MLAIHDREQNTRSTFIGWIVVNRMWNQGDDTLVLTTVLGFTMFHYPVIP